MAQAAYCVGPTVMARLSVDGVFRLTEICNVSQLSAFWCKTAGHGCQATGAAQATLQSELWRAFAGGDSWEVAVERMLTQYKHVALKLRSEAPLPRPAGGTRCRQAVTSVGMRGYHVCAHSGERCVSHNLHFNLYFIHLVLHCC